MARFLHRWLEPDEHILWRAMANHGPWNHRQVAGHLFLTDRRLVFRPTLFERMTEEVPWQGELGHLLVTVGPGPWRPRVPLLRKLALRYDVEAMDSHGTDEHFFVTHLGHDLQRVAVERIQE